MSLKRKAFTGLIWSFIQNSGTQIFTLLNFLVLARLLTPETFGLIALANVFLAFMQIFLEQGFAKALIQREELEPEHLEAAFWSQVVLGIFLTILTFLTAGLVAEIFRQPKLIPILQCLSSIFIIGSLSHVHNALLSREFAFKVMAGRSLWGSIISGAIGIGMAVSGYGVWSLVTLTITHKLFYLLFTWSTVDWRPKWQFSPQHFRDLYSFGMYLFGFKLVKFFDKRADNLLIGYFLGEVALGYYAIAYRILETTIALLVGTVSKVALPTFSRLQTEPERFRQLFYQTTQLTSLIAFPVYFGIIVFAPELIVTLFGQQWIPSIVAMRILALEGIVVSISLFHRAVFLSMGKPDWNLRLVVLSATINLMACAFAVRWGINAVAAAYLLSGYLIFPVSQWAVSRLVKIEPMIYGKKFITTLFCSGIMVVAIIGVKRLMVEIDPKLSIAAGTLVGAFVYAGCIRIIEPQLFEQFWNIVKSIFSKKTTDKK